MSGIGQVVRIGARVMDADGADLNAVTAVLTMTVPPDGTTVVLDVLSPPTVVGRYQVDYVPVVPGTYSYRWQFTQPAVSQEGTFTVSRPGDVGLLSLAAAKRLLRIDLSDSRYDEEIADVGRRATELAERECARVLVRRVVSETFTLHGWRSGVHLTQQPVIRPTLVERLASDGTVIEAVIPPAVWTDEAGILRCDRPAMLWGLVRVTYVAGPDVVSDSDMGAVEYLLQHLWANRGGSNARPRVGGSEEAPVDPETRTAIPTRVTEQLGPRAPLVG